MEEFTYAVLFFACVYVFCESKFTHFSTFCSDFKIRLESMFETVYLLLPVHVDWSLSKMAAEYTVMCEMHISMHKSAKHSDRFR